MKRIALLFVAAACCACSAGDAGAEPVASSPGSATPEDGGSTGPGAEPGGGDTAGGLDGDPAICTKSCKDFPLAPFVDPTADPPISDEDIARFDDPDAVDANSLCVLEPHLSSGDKPGAMVPLNWLRPRFRWQAGSQETLFEVRLRSDREQHDLRAYTRNKRWTLPRNVWEAAAPNLREVTVTIRGLMPDGKLSGSRGTFAIAPVEAGGSMVFWATTSSEVSEGSSKLHGFSVGDEAVLETLRASAVKTTPMLHENGRDLRGEYGGKAGFEPGEVQCIGCHVGTPDGKAVVFTDDYPWPKVVSSIQEESVGSTPSYISKGAEVLLKQPWLGTQTMSAGHWLDGDRILIATYGQRTEPFAMESGQNDRLIWFDLETTVRIPGEVPPVSSTMPPSRDELRNMRNALITSAKGKAWDTLKMDGEKRNAVTPNFSYDGTRIAYVSTDLSPNGHPAYEAKVADILIVPYNNRAGGTVTPLKGASSDAFLEYYPAFSPDDALVTFTRAPTPTGTQDGPYYNRSGEIFVVPSAGSDDPTRLRANDPVACSGETSPGVLNSWSKWSPKVRSQGGRDYYFLVFSSARSYPEKFDIPRAPYTPKTLDTRSSQLYMAAVVVDKTGKIETYPAVYLWNQDILLQAGGTTKAVASSNLTPAWAEFDLPPIPVI